MPRADQSERLAPPRFIPYDALDEDFDAAAAHLLPEKARLYDARVVHDDHVPRVENAGKVAEFEVAQRAVAGIEMQEAAGGALRRGVLGDEFGRQCVVELGNAHPRQL